MEEKVSQAEFETYIKLPKDIRTNFNKYLNTEIDYLDLRMS